MSALPCYHTVLECNFCLSPCQAGAAGEGSPAVSPASSPANTSQPGGAAPHTSLHAVDSCSARALNEGTNYACKPLKLLTLLLGAACYQHCPDLKRTAGAAAQPWAPWRQAAACSCMEQACYLCKLGHVLGFCCCLHHRFLHTRCKLPPLDEQLSLARMLCCWCLIAMISSVESTRSNLLSNLIGSV
jgi:hypothetical protein